MKISELGDKNWPIAYRKCLYDFKMKESAAIAKYYRPEKIYKYYSFIGKRISSIMKLRLIFHQALTIRLIPAGF